MGNYPTAWRRPELPDFHGKPQGSTLPRPANDNWRSPRPANDNFPGKASMGRAMRALGFANPWLRLGLWAYDAYQTIVPGWFQLIPGGQEDVFIQDPRWTTFSDCTDSRQPTFFRWFSLANNTIACTNNQALAENLRNGITAPNPANVYRSLWRYQYTHCPPNPGFDYASCNAVDNTHPRFRITGSWTKPNDGLPNPLAPHWTVLVHPATYNWFYTQAYIPADNMPTSLPVAKPVPRPRPLPISMLTRNTAKRMALQEWISPTFKPEEEITINPWAPPNSAPLIRSDNYEFTSNITISANGAARSVNSSASGHVLSPPPKGTKERKFIMDIPSGSFLGIALNISTEGLDVLHALYYAIPREHRNPRKEKTPQAKAYALYKHFNNVDVEQALQNLVYNFAEDVVYGGIGKLSGRAQRHAYNTTGIDIRGQLGGSFRRKAMQP